MKDELNSFGDFLDSLEISEISLNEVNSGKDRSNVLPFSRYKIIQNPYLMSGF
jgi:hypothetical protein